MTAVRIRKRRIACRDTKVVARAVETCEKKLRLSHNFRLGCYSNIREKIDMPKFVIEREIPGAGKLTAQDLKGIAQKSCGVLSDMGPKIQWIQSYVTDDKVYCIYQAPDEGTVLEHARRGGFPANSVLKVSTVIDPATAE